MSIPEYVRRVTIDASGENPFIITAHPDAVRVEKEKARVLRKSQWWQRQIGKGRCHYCGKTIPPRELTMDHIVPLIRGGRSTRGNVVPACKECNSKKKYLLPVEWEEYLQNLAATSTRVQTPTPEESEEKHDEEL